MKTAYLVDVDGTVADLTHRVHHYARDHVAFELGIPDDSPIEPVIRIVRALDAAGEFILFASGRTERTRDATETWFRKHDVPFDRLYMRQDGDHRADHIVKREILDQIRADGFDIVGVIDDRQSVVDMWREQGLTVLQNAPNPISSGFQTPDGLRPLLTIMVGPSGAGKTTWLKSPAAWEKFGIHEQHVISSDRIRFDMFGTDDCMDKNEYVFDALHTVAKTRLKMGLPVCLDATHIRDRDRRLSAELGQGVCPVRYIVIDRPLAAKLATGGHRLAVIGRDGRNLVERHDHVFRSNIRNIMAGDELPLVYVVDQRIPDPSRQSPA